MSVRRRVRAPGQRQCCRASREAAKPDRSTFRALRRGGLTPPARTQRAKHHAGHWAAILPSGRSVRLAGRGPPEALAELPISSSEEHSLFLAPPSLFCPSSEDRGATTTWPRTTRRPGARSKAGQHNRPYPGSTTDRAGLDRCPCDLTYMGAAGPRWVREVRLRPISSLLAVREAIPRCARTPV